MRPDEKRMLFRIAATEDVSIRRTFLFHGATVDEIKDAFGRLTGSVSLMADGAEIRRRVVIRYGKPQAPVEVRLIGPHTRYYPPELMRELITLVIEKLTCGKVEWMPLEEFINLKTTNYGLH